MKNKKGLVLSVLFVFFIFGVSLPLFMTNHKKVKAETITNLTGTTWVFNDSQVWTQDINIYLNFTSNNNQFTLFYVYYDEYLEYSYYNSSLGYVTTYNGTWTNQEYKTITITGGGGATDTTFINWLQAHATQQQPTPTGTEITHKYWASYLDMNMSDNEIYNDDYITYKVLYNQYTDAYNDQTLTGLAFTGKLTSIDDNFSYIYSTHDTITLYKGNTNIIDNVLWLEFTLGDYMDENLYELMDDRGVWFDDASVYLAGTNLGSIYGFNRGVAYGEANATQYTSLVTNILNGLGNILSIQVFPNITISLLIGLPLLLGVLVIVLKILRG